MRVNRPIIRSALDRAGSDDQRREVGEHRNDGKLEDLGDAVLEQQQTGDEAKQAERNRLPLLEHSVELVHVLSPWFDDPRRLALSQYPACVTGV
jgi:hypothetical protein